MVALCEELTTHKTRLTERLASQKKWHTTPGAINGFLTETKLLILKREMIRIATALITLLSVLSTPVASAMCSECCQRPVEHKVTLCHDHTHAQLGPHVHHLNHVHMIAQESDAKAAVQRCKHELQSHRQSCQSAACLSAKPVQVSAAPVATDQLEPPSHLIVTAICASLTISNPLPPPRSLRKANDYSQSASAPLRI